MNKNLRWKVITTFAVLALAVFFFYPPDQKVKLGLDLKGGVHLVLKVQTDDAVKLETEVTAERQRETMATRGIFGATVTPEPPTRFRVTGVPGDKDAEFRRLADEFTTTMFNRTSAGSGAYAFDLKPNQVNALREGAVEQALQTIERRVNDLGVAEPIVARHGMAGDQLLV